MKHQSQQKSVPQIIQIIRSKAHQARIMAMQTDKHDPCPGEPDLMVTAYEIRPKYL